MLRRRVEFGYNFFDGLLKSRLKLEHEVVEGRVAEESTTDVSLPHSR